MVPTPAGYYEASVRPEKAYYDLNLGEFILIYDDVQIADQPAEMLLDFLQSTYEAGAKLGNWDRTHLERS